jgi:hypothetical protein
MVEKRLYSIHFQVVPVEMELAEEAFPHLPILVQVAPLVVELVVAVEHLLQVAD